MAVNRTGTVVFRNINFWKTESRSVNLVTCIAFLNMVNRVTVFDCSPRACFENHFPQNLHVPTLSHPTLPI